MMNLRFCGLLPSLKNSARLLLLAACGTAAATTPDWVRAAASQPPMAVDKEANALVLLDDQTTTVSETGDVYTLYRRAVKILRPEGREYAKVNVYFDRETKLKSLHAWSITSKGLEYEVKDKDFVEVSPYSEDELYNDVRARVTEVPGADPGTVIAYEYEQRDRPYLLEDEWQFQERIPVQLARYTLRLPASWEYSDFWIQHPEVKPVEQGSGSNAWVWEVKQVPGIKHEPAMPQWRTMAGRMVISYYGTINGKPLNTTRSWQQIGSWYSHLTAGRRDASPEIRSKTLQLVAGKTSFEDKVAAISGFLQHDVRYVAIEAGIGGYQPHAAADVFKNRYGDCKDKVTLMSSMLHEAGIESRYLVVDTERGEVVPNAPSMHFNHVILAIELPGKEPSGYESVIAAKDGKKYLIFDPTDQYTAPGQVIFALQGSYGLLVADNSGELIQIPVLPPKDNELKRVAHLKLLPDGSLSGEVEETRSGEQAWESRYELLNSAQTERSKALDHFLGSFLNGFTVNKSEAEHLDQYDHDLVLKYSFTVPGYAKSAGPLLLLRPRVLGAKSEAIGMEKPRKFPVEFHSETHQTDIFEIELPAGYAVDELPDPVKVDVGFAQYESKIEVTGQTLRYTRDYTVNELLVPTTKEPELKRLFSSIYSDERNSAVLKKSN